MPPVFIISKPNGRTLGTYLVRGLFCFIILQVLVCSVSAVILNPRFAANVTSGSYPLTVAFTDGSEGSPDHWTWFFGDETDSLSCTVGNQSAWHLVNQHAGWNERSGQSSVVTPEGVIILMGGKDKTGNFLNDVWQSSDKGLTWSLLTREAEWEGRAGHTSVVLHDGSIVLMGGKDKNENYLNDVWKSSDNGRSWFRVTPHAAWSGRDGHSGVVMPNGNIILMGGGDSSGHYLADVWRSTDNGTIWKQVTSHADWGERTLHSSIVKPDGSIILIGGHLENGNSLEDVWRSSDYGNTWNCQNINNGRWNDGRWGGSWAQSSVVLPDGSIVIIGGWMAVYRNNVWRSTDNGATWTHFNASNAWEGRGFHSSVVLPDGSIVLMGGMGNNGPMNDVWRLSTAGSTEQNPVHTYSKPGNYSVSLQVFRIGNPVP